ncbi:hypothetical protein [Sorangium sp. So ce362]|uniref:hypothetical protein n=1 Tax=Sorangium sp. So ce362 TaxID=3133303 RepID=UPI003F5FFFC6
MATEADDPGPLQRMIRVDQLPARTVSDARGKLSYPARTVSDARGKLSYPARTVSDARGKLSYPARTVSGARGKLSYPARTASDARGKHSYPARTVSGARGKLSYPARTVSGARGKLSYPARTVSGARGKLSYPARTVSDARGKLSYPARTASGAGGMLSESLATPRGDPERLRPVHRAVRFTNGPGKLPAILGMSTPFSRSDDTSRAPTWNSVHAAAVEVLPRALRLLGVAEPCVDDLVLAVLLAAYERRASPASLPVPPALQPPSPPTSNLRRTLARRGGALGSAAAGRGAPSR